MGYSGPYADIHRHGEANAWLGGILAAGEGRPPYDWAAWRRSVQSLPPGPARLTRMAAPMPNTVRDAYLDRPEYADLVLEACLESAAASGAILAEFRVGASASLQPGFLESFRAAESAVRVRHPGFVAVVLLSGVWPARPGASKCIEACLEAGPEAFHGVDFIPFPYEEEVDWALANRAAERMHAAGFGVTAHAGEFTTAYLAPALELPGVTRIGHGTQLAANPRLLQRAIDRGTVIECCISSNVLLGAVESAAVHPARRFLDAGARIVLATDNPARFGTTIAAEYALAARLGLTNEELAACTRTAVEASFSSEDKKSSLLEVLSR